MEEKKHTHEMPRRDFLRHTALAGAGLTLGFAPPKETIKVGYLPITDATPLLIAHANGFYKDEGLQVERPSLIRGWSALVESFLTGKFDVVHLLLPIPIWMRFRGGHPVKIVAWDHLNGSALTVGRDTGITAFKHLGGKTVAVPYWYSMHNVILQMGIRKSGLKPVIKPDRRGVKKDEVNLVLLPPPEMPSALGAKKIHGYIVAEPFNALGELKLKANILRFTGDMWKNHPCCVVVMKESLLKNRPVTAQKVVNAVVRAQHWILQNLENTAAIMSREGKGYLPMNRETLMRVFTGYSAEMYGKGKLPQAIRHPEWGCRRIGFQPYPYPSATRYIFERLRETLVQGHNEFLQKITPDQVVNELVEYDFVKKAVTSLGGPSLFTDMNPASPWEREEVIEI